jgi:CO dehydrogenase maturation factor
MKLAISGKGGVGKTTLAALLARALAEAGRPVTAVDADPATNLALALGLPPEDCPQPISEMREMIEERTGSKGSYGAFFKINPDVRDLPEKYSGMIHGVRVLALGGVKQGGSGCFCPENALLKALVSHLLLQPREVVILDMEAGVEHLGRATAQAVSAMLIVIEPGLRSLQTALTIQRLAAEIGIPRVGVILNKVAPGSDPNRLLPGLDAFTVLGTLSFDPEIARADLEGRSPYTGREPQLSELRAIFARLEAWIGEPTSAKSPGEAPPVL